MSTNILQKPRFLILNIKKNLLSIIFLLFTIALVLFSNSNLSAAKKGLYLWANSVVPSLFPFFIATELLSNTNIIIFLGRKFNNWMKPIFNVRGEGSFALIMGILSGYPVGAKIATDFRKNNICSKEECERLLSFTNNSGPLFIIGTVGINMFGNSLIGLLLFITHFLSSITVGIIFRFWKLKGQKYYDENYIDLKNYRNTFKCNNNKGNNTVTLNNLGEILASCITKSISTIMMIGGFVVLFSVIISILKSSKLMYFITVILSPIFKVLNLNTLFIEPILTGFLEITNGISILSNVHIKQISINIILTAFLLGFGGISVLLQVLSITSKSDLSIKPYIYGKLLQGTIAAIYTFLFILIFPFLNFNL